MILLLCDKAIYMYMYVRRWGHLLIREKINHFILSLFLFAHQKRINVSQAIGWRNLVILMYSSIAKSY